MLFMVSSARFSCSTFTLGSPMIPASRPSVCSASSACTRPSGSPRAVATRGTCRSAKAGLMCGSRPLAEVVSMSPGTGVAPAFATSAVTRSTSALLVGPVLDAPELPAL